jgi:hypothetical protein
VSAEREPLFFLPMNIEPRPAPYSGAAAVCTNGPTRGDEFALDQDPLGMESRYRRAPQKSNTHSFRMIDHQAMESRTPHPKGGSAGEPRFGG